jgi:hypothetical protein
MSLQTPDIAAGAAGPISIGNDTPTSVQKHRHAFLRSERSFFQ